jgi:hypothetical protein
MRFNDAGFLEGTIGMPVAHMEAFLNVARSQKCAILVRATGPTCHGLLDEGYDTKGYRIHGKSCDWGPMAGFVMRDPRLNKYGLGKADFNRAKHKEALDDDAEGQGWKASTTPLMISQRRVDWLREHGQLPNLSVMIYGYRGRASKAGVDFNYALVKATGDLYSVCFDHTQPGPKWIQETGRYFEKYRSRPDHEPMLAMTNPPQHCGLSHNAAPHLKAITGDYDLFAIWPYAENYKPGAGGDDHRPLGTVRGSNSPAERRNVEHLERNFTRGGQGTKLGNITNRIYMVCQLVNSLVGRQVLWHSDEAARPFLDDVDLPVIAFNPAGSYFGLETIDDFKTYIAACEQSNIHVTLSNAWAQDPTAQKPNRLGADYGRFVPADGVRIIVPNWYNR